MGIKSRLVIILSLVCALAIQAQQAMRRHSANRSTNNPAWSELQSSMEKMHVAMASVEASGNSDADFVRLMIPHHQAAIDMARTQLLYGKDPQMRRLAQEIITDQQSEIELMSLWLKQHGLDSSNAAQTKPGTREKQ
ncbi:MAG TPA: DUF305 domain-containing protein [Blastocatellia bacterium]|nr:DUF305 domain-containing protein [Blastocatellia bacterium]